MHLVLTAHPTDIARRSVLSKHLAVSSCLEQLDDPRLGARERRRLEEDIAEALSIWYATNEVRSMRRRVADEVRRLLFFFVSQREVRENAPELHSACSALLPGYGAARSETERIGLLTNACLRAPLPEREGGPVPKAAAAFDAVAHGISAYGPESLDTFIVSNAEQPSDVLCALWLARRSGLFCPPFAPPPGTGRASALELVPLFERRGALERATETMGLLDGDAAYAEQLRARGNRQEVKLVCDDRDLPGVFAQCTPIATLETALSAADLEIGERYLALADGPEPAQRVWSVLAQERARCEARVLAITGRAGLTDRGDAALEQDRWRRAWLDALSFLQVELLRRHRAGDDDAREPLLATVAGIATGLRTTG